LSCGRTLRLGPAGGTTNTVDEKGEGFRFGALLFFVFFGIEEGTPVGAARILRTLCAAYGSGSVRGSDVGRLAVQRNNQHYRISDPASAPTGERVKPRTTPGRVIDQAGEQWLIPTLVQSLSLRHPTRWERACRLRVGIPARSSRLRITVPGMVRFRRNNITKSAKMNLVEMEITARQAPCRSMIYRGWVVSFSCQ
jgi:hypothetical protein